MKKFNEWKLAQDLESQPTDPFFSVNGIVLTKDLFIRETRLRVAMIGLDPLQYSGHSFRSGSATTAAMAGMSDWEIKVLGRWTSDAYQRYIRAPVTMLSSFASRMSNVSLSSEFNYRNPYITNIFN